MALASQYLRSTSIAILRFLEHPSSHGDPQACNFELPNPGVNVLVHRNGRIELSLIRHVVSARGCCAPFLD